VGEIGEVMHLAKSGRLIVKVSSGASPKPGELLVDGAGKRIGRIAELMGPTDAPYASVIPMTDRTSRLVGAKIFSGGFAERRRTSRPSGRRSR
jgi:RNA-binding protein